MKNTAKIVLIVIVCILSLLALYFLFLQFHNPTNNINQRIENNRNLINDLIAEKEKEREGHKNELADKPNNGSSMIAPDGINTDNNEFGTKIIFIDKNLSLPHILDNGEKAFYMKPDSQSWYLEEGDTFEIEIYADKDYFNSPGTLIFGYYLDGEEIQIEKFQIDKYKKIVFTVSTPGEYSFYLRCASSDPIIIEGVVIK